MTYFSAGRACRQLLLLIAATVLLAAFTPGCKVNPVTGQQQLNFISREQALALGDEQHSSVVRTYNGTMDMPELNAYLTDIVLRLHKNSHTPNMQVDFTLLNSSVVNAFALPGHVYATRGFVAKVENEAQFAAVMGHELAHVSAGHVAQQMSRQTLSQLGLSMAGIALGTDTLASRGALQAARLGTGLLNLSYSRDQERQADRAGTYYTALSGWEPQAALQVQKLIHDIEEKQQSVLAKYLSTHPPLSERLDAITSVINEKNLRRYVENDGLFKKRWQQRTAEMRRIHRAYQPYDEGEKALQDDRPREALQKAREAIEMRADQAPFYRLKGDALLELDRFEEARKAYQTGLELDEDYTDARVGLGRLSLQRDENKEAVRHFRQVLQQYPGSVRARWGLGKAKFDLGQYAEAASALEKVVSAAPKAAPAHYLLAACYERTGNPVQAYRHYRRAASLGLSPDREEKARAQMQALEQQLKK